MYFTIPTVYRYGHFRIKKLFIFLHYIITYLNKRKKSLFYVFYYYHSQLRIVCTYPATTDVCLMSRKLG